MHSNPDSCDSRAFESLSTLLGICRRWEELREAANANESLCAGMVLSTDRVCVRSSERGRGRGFQGSRMPSRPAMK